MKTIAIDYDGVLHAYSKGWYDGSCYDDPMPGAFDGLVQLLGDYTVFILSTREPRQIVDWLARHQAPFPVEIIPAETRFWNKRGVVGVTNRKLPAQVYVDDRAYLFRDWETVAVDRLGFGEYPKGFST